MTARLFGFDAPLTALLGAIDNGIRWLARGMSQAGSPARPTDGARRRTLSGRQPAYFDDRMLGDIGLRRDDFPSVARERLQDRVLRFHF
jgi:hypothetical protein